MATRDSKASRVFPAWTVLTAEMVKLVFVEMKGLEVLRA